MFSLWGCLSDTWFWKFILGRNSFCVRFVTQLQISKISIKTSKAWTLMFSLWGCLSDTWFWQNVIFVNEFSKVFWWKSTKWLLQSMNQFYVCWQRSLKVKAVSPKQNSDKMLYLWMNMHKVTSLEYEPVLCFLTKIWYLIGIFI